VRLAFFFARILDTSHMITLLSEILLRHGLFITSTSIHIHKQITFSTQA
jgi:hypothetical protein